MNHFKFWSLGFFTCARDLRVALETVGAATLEGSGPVDADCTGAARVRQALVNVEALAKVGVAREALRTRAPVPADFVFTYCPSRACVPAITLVEISALQIVKFQRQYYKKESIHLIRFKNKNKYIFVKQIIH
jgi:hypothetical protein